MVFQSGAQPPQDLQEKVNFTTKSSTVQQTVFVEKSMSPACYPMQLCVYGSVRHSIPPYIGPTPATFTTLCAELFYLFPLVSKLVLAYSSYFRAHIAALTLLGSNQLVAALGLKSRHSAGAKASTAFPHRICSVLLPRSIFPIESLIFRNFSAIQFAGTTSQGVMRKIPVNISQNPNIFHCIFSTFFACEARRRKRCFLCS